MKLLLTIVAALAMTGCPELQRGACHVDANANADARWAEVCGDSEWDECPQAQELAEELRDDLKECDR